MTVEVEVEILVDVRVVLISEKLSHVDVRAIKMRVDVYFIFVNISCVVREFQGVVKTANTLVR